MSETTCRRIVMQRSQGICERCQSGRGCEMHHRLNRSQGGRWEPANIVHLCHDCHAWVGENRDGAATAEGWHVLPGTDPQTVPVAHYLFAGFMLRLDNAGMFHTTGEPKPATCPRSDGTTPYAVHASGALGHATRVPESQTPYSEIDRRDDERQMEQDYRDSHGPSIGEGMPTWQRR
jgi:hypothetical protein